MIGLYFRKGSSKLSRSTHASCSCWWNWGLERTRVLTKFTLLINGVSAIGPDLSHWPTWSIPQNFDCEESDIQYYLTALHCEYECWSLSPRSLGESVLWLFVRTHLQVTPQRSRRVHIMPWTLKFSRFLQFLEFFVYHCSNGRKGETVLIAS